MSEKQTSYTCTSLLKDIKLNMKLAGLYGNTYINFDKINEPYVDDFHNDMKKLSNSKSEVYRSLLNDFKNNCQAPGIVAQPSPLVFVPTKTINTEDKLNKFILSVNKKEKTHFDMLQNVPFFNKEISTIKVIKSVITPENYRKNLVASASGVDITQKWLLKLDKKKD